MGIIDRWITKTFARITPRNQAIYPVGGMKNLYENPTDQKKSLDRIENEKHLSLADLKSIFYLWTISLAICVGVLVLEVLMFRMKK